MNTHKSINPIKPASIAKWTLIALAFGGMGLQIVNLKNQQVQLGQKIRKTEQMIRKTHLHNQILLTEIVILSSRSAIQKKLISQGTVMLPIQNQYITRISPPEIIQGDTLRTASSERLSP